MCPHTCNVEAIDVPLNVDKCTLLQTIDTIILEIKIAERCGILESPGSDVADVVVIQMEMDKPLQVIKDSIINNSDVIEAEINGL